MNIDRFSEIRKSISKELKLKLLAQLVSGLAASGHFTCEENEAGDEYHFQLKVSCFRHANGELEKSPTLIAAAERLLDEIIASAYVDDIYDE